MRFLQIIDAIALHGVHLEVAVSEIMAGAGHVVCQLRGYRAYQNRPATIGCPTCSRLMIGPVVYVEVCFVSRRLRLEGYKSGVSSTTVT
jgi:hypothetical protein